MPPDPFTDCFLEASFLDPFLDSFLTDFGSHSGRQNPPYYHKNRFPEALHSLSDPVSGWILASVGIPFWKQYTFKIIKIHKGLCLQIENDLLGVDIEI